MCSNKGSTYFPVSFKTWSGRPVLISNPGHPREKPVLSHCATDKVLHSLTHSDSPDDIVHYRLARKHKNCKDHTHSFKSTLLIHEIHVSTP